MKYFISDLHNYDENIIVYGHRPFANCESMRNAIIERWNRTVYKQAEVFLLGDIGDPEILTELYGRITIVMGNHDDYDELKRFASDRIEISRYPIMVDGCILSHEPLPFLPKESPYMNIHGHLHNLVQLMGDANNKNHLAYGDWKSGCRFFNVSVENINYTPISMQEIAKRIGYVGCGRRKDFLS